MLNGTSYVVIEILCDSLIEYYPDLILMIINFCSHVYFPCTDMERAKIDGLKKKLANVQLPGIVA